MCCEKSSSTPVLISLVDSLGGGGTTSFSEHLLLWFFSVHLLIPSLCLSSVAFLSPMYQQFSNSSLSFIYCHLVSFSHIFYSFFVLFVSGRRINLALKLRVLERVLRIENYGPVGSFHPICSILDCPLWTHPHQGDIVWQSVTATERDYVISEQIAFKIKMPLLPRISQFPGGLLLSTTCLVLSPFFPDHLT